MHCQQLNLA
jgi:hypothetical protein